MRIVANGRTLLTAANIASMEANNNVVDAEVLGIDTQGAHMKIRITLTRDEIERLAACVRANPVRGKALAFHPRGRSRRVAQE